MPSPKSRDALAVVLAAGEGTRMKSTKPKVLHEIAGRSMLAHVLASLWQSEIGAVAVVHGPNREDVRAEAASVCPHARFFTQHERRGTAHAVLAAREAIAEGFDDIVVVFADTPLVRASSLLGLRAALADGASVAALGFQTSTPFGYGRLILDAAGGLRAIREERDATDEERAITLCNAGFMGLDGARAIELLDKIDANNAKGEFYLTDAILHARAAGLDARVVVGDASDALGVNDRAQLAEAEAAMQQRLRAAVMAGGATLIAPETVFMCADTRIGRDVVIEPHVFIGLGVEIGDGAVVHAFSHLEGARIGERATVGPFARLRPGAELSAQVKVGNFVEIKATKLGEGAKVSHLTYLGDAEVGADANIGAGTITCNYDGFFKYRTSIGAGAFIGSNSALVAPVSVGDGAIVGAGSVIAKDVAADALAVARGVHAERPGWAKAFREMQSAKKATGR